MARPAKPERKAELLSAILDYLMDRTLAELTFRSLAEGLGISTYVLVYHFGSREQLVNDIVAAEPRGTSQENFRMLHQMTRDWLVVQGIPVEFADTDARLFTSTFYGLQFDYVVMNQAEAATRAFELMLTVFFNNLESRLAAAAGQEPAGEPVIPRAPGQGAA